MDPRGVGQSAPAIDCKANQETQGIYSQPITTPDNLDVTRARSPRTSATSSAASQLNHEHPARTSRRRTSRATSTCCASRWARTRSRTSATRTARSWAPPTRACSRRNYRAMVLDGPVDANAYINDPMRDLSAQTSGFERALGRFFQACAADHAACRGFPERQRPVGRLRRADRKAQRRPAAGRASDTLDGDDVTTGTAAALYSKATGRSSPRRSPTPRTATARCMKALVGLLLRRQRRRHVRPGRRPLLHDRRDRAAVPARRAARTVGRQALVDQHEHIWWNNGYIELNYGLYPVHDHDAFDGPFKVPGSAVTPLVIGDDVRPGDAVPRREEPRPHLGNARLLTMRGDGHTAYNGQLADVHQPRRRGLRQRRARCPPRARSAGRIVRLPGAAPPCRRSRRRRSSTCSCGRT